MRFLISPGTLNYFLLLSQRCTQPFSLCEWDEVCTTSWYVHLTAQPSRDDHISWMNLEDKMFVFSHGDHLNISDCIICSSTCLDSSGPRFLPICTLWGCVWFLLPCGYQILRILYRPSEESMTRLEPCLQWLKRLTWDSQSSYRTRQLWYQASQISASIDCTLYYKTRPFS